MLKWICGFSKNDKIKITSSQEQLYVTERNDKMGEIR